MAGFQNNSIFWVEVNKINPNPYQPRKEFDQKSLEDLADSIRQYGVLQPLVVTRREIETDAGGLRVEYELIAGERRLRASKIAGIEQVPVVIRSQEDSDNVKLELAIIENLQREDLNPIDRALAFEKLHKEFGLTHVDIGKKMGRSREFVSNSVRLLQLPEEIQNAVTGKRITEGHTRPLLMLSGRDEEQMALFNDIIARKMSVREAERIARRIAQDKVRKQKFVLNPQIQKAEQVLSENLGARVHIEQKEKGGKILIDYFGEEELNHILDILSKREVPEDVKPTEIPENDLPDLYKPQIESEPEYKHPKTVENNGNINDFFQKTAENEYHEELDDYNRVEEEHPIFFSSENVEN